MPERVLPTGTITFLFSDMEDSTRLVAELGPAVFTEILERHNAELRKAFARYGATERGTQGDSFLVMFPDAPAALAAAADAQRALADVTWPAGADIRVRMGIHTGTGILGGDDYVGLDVNRAARIAAAAYGGQVLLSDTTRTLTERDLPAGSSVHDLGEHTLRDLGQPERLYQLVIGGLRSDFPPVRSIAAATLNLPQRLTSFVGRESELVALAELLRTSRLITLTGPGGTGKSSLAVELARSQADRFAHGAWFIPLASVPDASLVAETFVDRLRILMSGRSAVDALTAFLADRSILLVIDNFEHVLDAAPLITDLLLAAPGLSILVSSRAPLHLSGEQEYPVTPLPVPDAGDVDRVADPSPAVRLFVERARRVRPDFELTAAHAPAVAEICRRLDGLPLGIELAASRIGLFPLPALAERIARQLDLPGPTPRDAPERLRTLRATVAWSHDLLDAADRAVFAHFSVFAGGCRLEEAEPVCDPKGNLGRAVIDSLSHLVDQNLIQPRPGPDGPRFRMLETIRMFASEQLAADDPAAKDARRRHAMAYLALAEVAAAHMPAREQVEWLDRLTADQDNMRAAIQWAIEAGNAPVALRLGAALWRFWQLRVHLDEGLTTLRRILAMSGADEPSVYRIRALEAVGGIHWWRAEIAEADASYAEALTLARELDDPQTVADACFNLAHSRFGLLADPAEPQALLDEAEALYRRSGDERGVARSQYVRGFGGLTAQGRLEEIRALMQDLLTRFEALGDEFYVGLAALVLGGAAMRDGRLDEAAHWGLRSLRSSHTMGDIPSTTLGLRAGALLLVAIGLPEDAATINAAFLSAEERNGVRIPVEVGQLGPFDWLESAGADEILVSPEYADAIARGSRMSLDQALTELIRMVEGASAGRSSADDAAASRGQVVGTGTVTAG